MNDEVKDIMLEKLKAMAELDVENIEPRKLKAYAVWISAMNEVATMLTQTEQYD